MPHLQTHPSLTPPEYPIPRASLLESGPSSCATKGSAMVFPTHFPAIPLLKTQPSPLVSFLGWFLVEISILNGIQYDYIIYC